jgi:hypothetical protein
MTIAEYFAAGKYADFILIDDEVYIFPPGFKLTQSPKEKRNAVVMANGRTREDIIRRWTKFSFAYDTIFDGDFKTLKTIVEKSPGAEKILYLRKQNPASGTDYETAVIDVISPVKSGYSSRGNLFVHTGVTLEME